MTVNLSLLGGAGWQFSDNNGVPLPGGLLYTYAAGTTTPQTTYISNTGVTANANPVVLDSAGRIVGEIWLTQGQAYKFVLKNAAGVTIGTYDNVPGANDPTDIYASIYATLAAPSGSSLIGYQPAGTGSVATTVQTKLRESVSVFDFMTSAQIADVQAGTLSLDVTTAMQAALDSGAQEVIVPPGAYRVIGLEIKSGSVLTKFIGSGTPTISLVTGSNRKAITISKSQFVTISGFIITSTGSVSDGNLTKGIYAESKSFMQFDNLRFTNFSESGFEAKQVVYFTLTNITAADCLYGITFSSSIAAPCTTCSVTSSYITGCARGIFQESGVQMVYKDCIFEYCGTTGGNNGAFHANGGGALLIGAYFEANERNIVASDTGLTFENKYELAAAAGNVITYVGAPFDFRGTTAIYSNTINTRFLAPDTISGYDLQLGTNLIAPLAGGSVAFGNQTMAVANGSLTSATWTTVYTIPAAEVTGTAVNALAMYEYTCYAGAADLSTGFDSGTIMNSTLRSYSGSTPAWLRLSSNLVQMNVTNSSYGLLYKIVMRRIYPS
jgi:DNA/RNA endonuclease YhcR with UshA esterase domain